MNVAEIIELVAEAIDDADAVEYPPDFPAGHPPRIARARSAILAMLDAIREPSAAIIDEGLRVSALDFCCHEPQARVILTETWRAQIDVLKRAVAG